MAIKSAKDLAAAAEAVAKNYKTLYIMGCFGAPMTEKNKDRYTKNHSYNKQAFRAEAINAASEDTFGFDCVCLIKGLLWGWNGDKSKTYGGATYKANDVPDIGADSMIKVCSDLSTDFSKIEVGEAVWMEGHIGVYIGDGLAVECTPAWENCVQITSVHNIGTKAGYNGRTWEKHGKLPWLDYSDQEKPEVIYQVYAGGKWLPEVTNYNTENSNGYAGVFGKPISDIRVRLSNGNPVSILTHSRSGWSGGSVDGIAMEAEWHQLKYRVHIESGKWLPWVTGCDTDDSNNGYAGIYGKTIDAVQIDVVK